MQITLSPVYSKLANEIPPALQPLIPAGWRLSQHQVETYLALADPNGPEVVINTAMTGDGKSLGGQLLSLQKGWDHALFAMYPTNELIADQAGQAAKTLKQWKQSVPIAELNSRVLDEMMDSDDFRRRADALSARMNNNGIILTNPDIFHYIMQIFYVRVGKHGDAPDMIFGKIFDLFQQFTFDEFHVFETPQVASVMCALLLLRAIAGPKHNRYLFQSATPSPLLRSFLEKGGFTYQEIKGDYQNDATQADPVHWRQILQASELHFAEGSVEQWLDANLESVLLPFFVQNKPAAKGAIIVNSIAQAKRVKQKLERAFASYDFSVGENTGLTTMRERRASYDADILVGTSTVDVGVDFHINFLLFESRDAGTFLQRLGRLGRHKDYERNDQTISFADNFVAHALLPRWTLESLFQDQPNSPAPLTEGMTLPRTELAGIINTAFPQATSFERYIKCWGGFQAIRVLNALTNKPIRDQYRNVRDSLSIAYQAVLGVRIDKLLGRYIKLEANAKTLLDEVITFRGGSYFDCGVLDMTEGNPNEQAKRYDLLWLVANSKLAPLSKEEFWTQASRAGMVEKSHHAPVAYFRLLGFRPERANFTIYLDKNINDWNSSDYGIARELSGITLQTDYTGDVPNLNTLNSTLTQLRLPVFLCQKNPFDLKQKFRLPMLFAVYAFRSRDGVTGSIAFGREALLLDSAIFRRDQDCGGGSLFL